MKGEWRNISGTRSSLRSGPHMSYQVPPIYMCDAMCCSVLQCVCTYIVCIQYIYVYIYRLEYIYVYIDSQVPPI